MHSWIAQIKHFLGIEAETVSNAEKIVSGIGGFVGIFFIAIITFQLTGATGAALIVPSMGASAVLVFAVPHGRLSQPWSLLGGHLVSAVIGVTCYQYIPDQYVAAGCAVGISIGVMHLLGCIHPPGGATALAAVIGGPVIHDLGYGYVVTPIMLNTLIIFLVAFIFNNVFPWRRYPGSMMRFTDRPMVSARTDPHQVDRQFIEQALADMDLVMDVTIDDLQRLFALVLEHAENQQLLPSQIVLGHYYTNGKHGSEWSVRHIIDESSSPDPDKDMVIYRVAEGRGVRSADSCSRSQFAQWAVREVFLNKEET